MSAASFFQRAGDIGNTRVGFIGQVINTGSAKRSYTGSNERPQTVQISTVSIPASPTASATYGLTAYGLTASYVADASATQDEVGAGLAAAWNAKPALRRLAIATYTGGTLTLTGTAPGVAFDNPTGSGGSGGGALGNASTSTAAASAARVYFGRVLASDGYVTNEGTPKVFIPTTSLFSAQVTTFTYASVASGDTITTIVRMNDEEAVVATAYNSSHAQTLIDHAADLKIALNAEFGAGRGAVAARSSDDITITADVAGAEFFASSTVAGTGGGTVSKADTTGPSISTSLARALAGISVRRTDVENETVDGDDPSYAPNDGVEVLSRGAIYMARSTSETWDGNSDTWVDLTTVLTSAGRIYDTPGNATSPVWLPRDLVRIERQEPSSQSTGVGVARVIATAIGA